MAVFNGVSGRAAAERTSGMVQRHWLWGGFGLGTAVLAASILIVGPKDWRRPFLEPESAPGRMSAPEPPNERRGAEEPDLAARTGPAPGVRDNIASTGSIPTDSSLAPTSLAPAAIAVTPAVVAPYRFSARREGGRLILRGHVPSSEARDQIKAVIRERFFHEQIADETRLADGAPPAFVAGATSAIEALSQLATGEAAVEGPTLKVSGEALYAQAAEAMSSRIAAAAPAGWRATAEVGLRDEQASPADAAP